MCSHKRNTLNKRLKAQTSLYQRKRKFSKPIIILHFEHETLNKPLPIERFFVLNTPLLITYAVCRKNRHLNR